MGFIESLFKSVAENVLGNALIESGEQKYDLSKSFKRITLIRSVAEKLSVKEEELKNRDVLESLAKKLHIADLESLSNGKLLFELFEEAVEESLDEPTFIIGYPKEISPLSRVSDDDPDFVERFELFIGGKEIANGFSELNDPDDQADRFKKQVEQKASGDEEAMEYDADYVEALEYGLPPCAGVGVGIDRLVMLLTGAPSIRDVLLFPQLKSKD
jgi:lysyl-tRNA synthetase class 2